MSIGADTIGNMTLGEIQRHIADQPVDAKRIKGLLPLSGQVDDDGTILGGTGFTVNPSATGTYDVTFDTSFTSTPTVVGSAVYGTAGAIRHFEVAVSPAADEAGFTAILKVGAAGTLIDAPFNFAVFQV